MKVEAVFLGGPYSGQAYRIPQAEYKSEFGYQLAHYLVNIWDGREVHCYLTERSDATHFWYLRYQDSF